MFSSQYENQIIENNPFQWNFETIWFGRWKQKYKISPGKLAVNEEITV